MRNFSIHRLRARRWRQAHEVGSWIGRFDIARGVLLHSLHLYVALLSYSAGSERVFLAVRRLVRAHNLRKDYILSALRIAQWAFLFSPLRICLRVKNFLPVK